MAFLSSDARPSFVARIPNGNGVSGVAALGHASPSGGGATNAFGEAFEAAGHQWTAELCQADSDGDGATNGEELGDACCSWTPSTALSSTLSPTHPGVPNSFTAAQLSAMKCGGEADLDASASSVASASSSGSFGDVVAPDDQPRFSPGPKLDETPQTHVTSGAGRQQTFVAAICCLSTALVLA
ncbi:hypothetical protein PHYSODRAFT_531037 [Phytophthora sojae]|uniref:Temptin Cys/Cys disulfide domain-containing protein n=1 Tax=Phytophthora sojae (strain P6497) TaxID=1094619 RepID=G5ACJ7_PHYSP|nr:hypothetical protein PHYSODRAFT_531037 [Phytophthora sojae]EGZ07071.1 hypothetical protein PHYSODRAFT_531037 [Phytophthora sojae]|eukprot:XP_009537835.1 hypothetical protein PHYSODRAFT_531037 [Phytophthora sojae]